MALRTVYDTAKKAKDPTEVCILVTTLKRDTTFNATSPLFTELLRLEEHAWNMINAPDMLKAAELCLQKEIGAAQEKLRDGRPIWVEKYLEDVMKANCFCEEAGRLFTEYQECMHL